MTTQTQTTRIVLITGGNRGLGRAAALALADAGTDVVLTYRSDAAEAAAVVAEIGDRGRRAVALHLDVTAFAGFDAFVRDLRATLRETWDRESVDGLLNNAGVGLTTPVGETGEDVIDQLVDTHFKGVFLLTQALLPVIADGGRILNVSSGLARWTAPGYAVYGALKGAVEVLTRYLAVELGPRGITVNTIAPGATATDFGGGYLQDEQVHAAISQGIALGRMGQPADIAGVVTALLAGDTGWVNGQRIEASGGSHL